MMRMSRSAGSTCISEVVAHMAFVRRPGQAEQRQCQNHAGIRDCYRCHSCDSWFCVDCDLVHMCHSCGGTYCWHCRPCQHCALRRAQGLEPAAHPLALMCSCGQFIDQVSGACEECFNLGCLAPHMHCPRLILTNWCCSREKCWHCSWWYTDTRGVISRVCRTCPAPHDAILQIQEFVIEQDEAPAEHEQDA